MSASAVTLAVLIAAIVCYMVVRSQLLGQVDNELQQQASLAQHDPEAFSGENAGPPSPSASAGGGAPLWQVATANGSVVLSSQSNVSLAINAQVEAIAAGSSSSYFQTVTIGGAPFRELTIPVGVREAPLGPSGIAALQLARPLGGVNNILRNLRLVLLLVCAGGIALAAALGRLAARPVLSPLAEVAATAQHIEETEDLSSRIRVHADDEVGLLARRFNAMIERLQTSRDALDQSVRAQRQLVADASHELRTPITSLRTNIEVLLEQGDELTGEDRRRLLADVLEQSEELSTLIGDVIELARGDLPISSAEDVRLDRVVVESLNRGRRDFPHVRFESSLDPVIVEGIPERLHRAVNNLLDNAAHHSPRDGVVEIVVNGDGVRVRDHGGGIDEADLPYVFDRFYRGANSRHRQGSGLGLAIVRQVATQHGGTIEADNAPDGGAVFMLRLPTIPAEAPDPEPSPRPVAGDPVPTR